MFNSNLLFYAFIIFSIIFFSACSSTHEIQTALPNKIAPNSSRINGTIINIEKIEDSSGPCSSNPCVANVKINNVIGTGFGFKTPLIKGKTIKIKFAFTLSETSKELFPKLNKSFPGLKIDDKFIGDVEKIDIIQLDKNKTKFEYRIFNYDKID